MPEISVIFTSFNHKEFLRQALDSLMCQTFTDFELIIIDDCSTDGSQEILKQYAAQDKRIELFLNEKNSGSYVHSTNLGASKAVGEYVLFAQCDDYAEPTQLEKLHKAMKDNPTVGVVYSASTMVDRNGYTMGEDYDVRQPRFKRQCAKDTLLTGEEMGRYFLRSCVIPNLSAALVKRTLFEKQGGLSSNYFVLADWDFWLKTTLETDFYYLREPLNNFRQHDTTIRASIKLKRQVEEVFRMYYDFFRISKIGLCKRLWAEFMVARVWLSYGGGSKKAWLSSFFPLLSRSMRYSLYFPIVMFLESVVFLCVVLFKKI